MCKKYLNIGQYLFMRTCYLLKMLEITHFIIQPLNDHCDIKWKKHATTDFM